MASLFQDFRFALRSCSRSPGFTTVAVLAFAIGIGANTAIFTVVHTVLLQRLPMSDPDRVVMVWEETSRRPGRPNTVGPANLVRWIERATSFDQLAAYFEGRTNLTGAGAPEELTVQVVTPNFFATLGTTALLGRTFAPGEGGDFAVLSHALWKRRFGGDLSIVGRSIQLNGRSTQIIGVMPPGAGVFLRDMTTVGRPVDLWTPFLLGPEYRQWQGRYMAAVARLRPGVSSTAAQLEMRTIAAAIENELPQNDTGWSVLLVPIRDAITGSIRPALLVLSGAVGFVLLIACANVANLLLARGAARQRELAVRRALGASRARIASQLLTESLVLALLGGAAGLLVAEWGIDALAALSPIDLDSAGPLRLNPSVLAFTAAVSLLTALASGIAFAIEGSRAEVQDTLTDSTRLVGVLRHRRVRQAFVVAEIALAVVLLFGAGLMLRSFANIRGVHPGFEPANVLTARVNLPLRKYSTSPLRRRFFRDATERLRALPGVEAAGAISFLPLAGPGAGTSFAIVGRQAPAPGQSPLLDVRVSDNGYFEAMRVPLIRGRLFNARELGENTHVAIVNDALARQYFPGVDPIGQRIEISMGLPPIVPSEIIGVVGDVRHVDLQTAARAMAYWPHSQLDYPAMTLTIRTSSDPATIAPAVEREIQSLDKDQPLSDVRTMSQWVGKSLAERRFTALLLAVFAAVAILLAAVGIYSVMSYAVTQRTAEIGLRLALGANERDILRMVVTGASRLTLVGLTLGIAMALALSGTLAKLLYQTRGTDPLTLVAVAILLGAVALLASYLPARRAARIEPVQALRHQ